MQSRFAETLAKGPRLGADIWRVRLFYRTWTGGEGGLPRLDYRDDRELGRRAGAPRPLEASVPSQLERSVDQNRGEGAHLGSLRRALSPAVELADFSSYFRRSSQRYLRQLGIGAEHREANEN